ncbi:ParA family protein [bacterium]|nr:ParA family protein [bacterium]
MPDCRPCNRQLQSAIGPRESPAMPPSVVVSMLARKGGVGKTSTALNLAGAALADGAQSVLLIDMDSQASLSRALLGPQVVDQLRPDQTVQAVAERTRTAGDVVRMTAVPGLLLVPSYPDLRVQPDAALHLAGVDPSLTIIDTPPDIRDSATRTALMAAHAVVSPLVPEAWAMQSVPGVQQLLMGTGIVSNQSLMFAGWLLNMVQRVALHGVCIDTMQRLHGAAVFANQVPAAVTFKEAAAAGLPITHHAPKSAGAKVIRAVFAELVDRIASRLQRGAA